MATRTAFPGIRARPPGALPSGLASGELVGLPWREIEPRIAEWDTLAKQAAEPNPFFESWYLLPALRALDPRGDVRLMLFEKAGKLAALLPLIRRNRYYSRPLPHLSIWLHRNCFLGSPLVMAGAEHAFWQTLIAWADRHAMTSLFLHIGQFPLGGPLDRALRQALASQSRRATLVHRAERAMLSSPLSPDAYLEAVMTGKKRKELRRQFARLSELGEIRLIRERGPDGVDSWAESFLTLEAAGWKGANGSALSCDARTKALFRGGLAGAAEHGRLERLTLALDGRPIAMLASFLASPGAFSYKTAFDESFARFSPGVLLQRENLSMLDDPHIAWTDSCAAAGHPMIDHIWRERRVIGSLSIPIGHPIKRAIVNPLLTAEATRAFRSKP